MSERAMTDRVGEGSAGERTERSCGSSLQGDRACTRCGFNLVGQPILRESHYGLLIARCPECGAAAPLTEYPSVSRWSRRIVGLLAAVWVMALVGVTVGSGAALFGLTVAASHESAEDLGWALENAYLAEQAQLAALGAGATMGPVAPGAAAASAGQIAPVAPTARVRVRFSSNAAPKDWVEKQDVPQRFSAMGGWAFVLGESGLFAIPVLIVAGVAGAFLGLAAMHQRRWRLAMVSVLPLGVCAAFHGIAYAGRLQGHNTPAEMAAMDYLWWRVTLVGMALALGAMTLSAVFARPIARGFVRLMLPPRMRVPLFPLWEADGLAPPRPRPGSRASAGISRPSA